MNNEEKYAEELKCDSLPAMDKETHELRECVGFKCKDCYFSHANYPYAEKELHSCTYYFEDWLKRPADEEPEQEEQEHKTKLRLMTLDEIIAKYPLSYKSGWGDVIIICSKDEHYRLCTDETKYLGEVYRRLDSVPNLDDGQIAIHFPEAYDQDILFIEQAWLELISVEVNEEPEQKSVASTAELGEELKEMMRDRFVDAKVMDDDKSTLHTRYYVNVPITKLFVYEEGSIDDADVAELKNRNPNILPIAFRAGSREPIIIELSNKED